jgi:DNA polymerase/3'-5' exonuclease PolX/8-oxo-dGTP pyrophosphatase MutT (NUDIX family)
MLSNSQIAKILHEIAEYLAMEDEPFRPRAYEKAARIVELQGQSLKKLYHKQGLKGLEDISGIGKEIAKKIEELLKTGRLHYLEKLKNQSPVDVATLTKIEGLGPKKIKALWQNLGVTDINSLEKVLREKKIQNLEGFGKKSEENILQGLEMLKKQKDRLSLSDVLPIAQAIKKEFQKLANVTRVEIAGSLRRQKETIGDIDMLVCSSHSQEVMNFFKTLPQLNQVYGVGEKKASGRLTLGIDIDVRVVKSNAFGAALQYFTGNQLHNIQLRRIAKKRGLKLNEYGLFRGKKRIAGKTEEGIYKKLRVVMPPPEKRTGEGEIKFTKRNVIYEKSVGGVVFYKADQALYLLLHYPPRNKTKKKTSRYGHWDFVKGHIEKDETQFTTLLREAEEETGLQKKDLKVIKNFKKPLHYHFKTSKGLHSKTVIFYLLQSQKKKVTLSFEHDDFKWLPYEEALKTITFKGGKEILKQAHIFLKK